jgi:hypothetical protein
MFRRIEINGNWRKRRNEETIQLFRDVDNIIFKLDVLLTAHHNISVQLNQRDTLFIQFIEN